MAQLSNTFETYDAVGNREDLQNVIYDISPTDTPFMSSIGAGNAEATKHEWQTDSLASAASNAQIEGDDSPSAALSATTRSFQLYTDFIQTCYGLRNTTSSKSCR